MEVKEKKMAAALAAVAEYLRQEEECLRQQAAMAAYPQSEKALDQRQSVAKTQASAEALNLWGLSGRQSMMQMRNLMQIKGLHRHA